MLLYMVLDVFQEMQSKAFALIQESSLQRACRIAYEQLLSGHCLQQICS
jgi:hypothetical protein